MEIKGTVINVTTPITGESAKGKWNKYTVVVDSGEKYNNIYAIEVFNDKVSKPNIGDNVFVDFNISCNEYQGKYYTSLSVWKLKIEGETTSPIDDTQQGEDLPF